MNKDSKKSIMLILGLSSIMLSQIGWLCVLFHIERGWVIESLILVIMFSTFIIETPMLVAWLNEDFYIRAIKGIQKVANSIVYGTHLADNDKDLIEHLKNLVRDFILTDCNTIVGEDDGEV